MSMPGISSPKESSAASADSVYKGVLDFELVFRNILGRTLLCWLFTPCPRASQFATVRKDPLMSGRIHILILELACIILLRDRCHEAVRFGRRDEDLVTSRITFPSRKVGTKKYGKQKWSLSDTQCVSAVSGTRKQRIATFPQGVTRASMVRSCCCLLWWTFFVVST